MRKFYTNANMLIRNFFKCSVDVKCYLFKTYCSTTYCSAMWFDTTKSAMKKLNVAYNNSLRRLLSLPTYNSASEMFAVLNIPSFGDLLRKFAFSFMSRMSSSINVFMVNDYNSSVPLFSKICLDLYGSQLWKYSKNDVNAFYIAWRKVVRRIWKIPSTTHCNLLPAIIKSLPIEFLMEKRCAKFIWSCFNSHNLIVRNISMAAKISSFSNFGDSYRYLSYKYGIGIHV